MKVLVTGGSGNIGAVVVEELLRGGHRVRVADQRAPSREGIEFAEMDVCDPKSVQDVMAGMEAVVHLAAIPAYKPEIPPVNFMHVNVTGTFNVLEAAGVAGVGKVVFAASDSALGYVFAPGPARPDYLPVDEDHPLRPQDPYGLSKLLGEELCMSATRKFGMQTIRLRFCWVWFEDTYQQRGAILEGNQETLAKTFWGHVSVEDAARACGLALAHEAPGTSEAFFITAEDTYAADTTADLICTHYPGVTIQGEPFEHGSHAGLFDIGRARRELGYAPQKRCHTRNS